MTDNHIVKATEVSIEKSNMHPLVTAAMSGGPIDTDTLSKLMDLQERWETSEAKKEFTQAMVNLKGNLPSVLDRDKAVSFGKTGYSFTSLAHAMTAVSPHLTRFGFSLSWIPVTSDKLISVTCRLTHTDGHYEETTLSAGADNSGSKNAVQAIGSTITYLERYTALALLGIATQDMTCADDREQDDDTVNTDRNLKAIGVLRQEGIELKDAEEHLKRSFKDWTSADLGELKNFIRIHREQREIFAEKS